MYDKDALFGCRVIERKSAACYHVRGVKHALHFNPHDRRWRRGGYNLGTPNDVRTERWCGSERKVIIPYQNILDSRVSRSL